MWSLGVSALPFLKNEIGASTNEREADRMIPAERLLQIDQREAREDDERDHLLHGLELRRRIDRIAIAIRRNREAVFDERDAPACEDHADERDFLEAQMSVPGDGHEQVGADQQKDGQQ